MALSSGLSRLCNTKVQYTGVTSGFPQGLKSSCIQIPFHALLLGRGHNPYCAGHMGQPGSSCSFTTSRESRLRTDSKPRRDQLPVFHTSARLKHLLEAPGYGLPVRHSGMKHYLAVWSVTMTHESPVLPPPGLAT